MAEKQQWASQPMPPPNTGAQPPTYQPTAGQSNYTTQYTTQQYAVAPQPQPAYVTQTVVTTNNEASSWRTAIPALPMVLAIILCVVNIILPGIGTVFAGFSVLCCGNVGQSGGGRFGTFCINFWVGLLQLVLSIFVVGWVWSIMWGIAFIAISAEADSKTTTTTVTTAGVPQPLPMATMTHTTQTNTFNV